MRWMRGRWLWTGLPVLACSFLGPPTECEAKIGLAARFGDVIMEGVQIGRSYSLREAAKVPFGVENRGDAETEVVVEFQPPRPSLLAKDYEPAPDLSWFRAVPDRLRLPAKGLGFFDLIMTIPDDPALIGKHYQVMVVAKGNSGMFGVAIENKIRISIGPGPGSVQAEKKRKAMQQLDFDVTPRSLYLTGIPLGRAYDTRKEQKKALRVANYAADALTVQFSVEKWDGRFAMAEGYEPIPDPGWIRMKTKSLSVGSDEIAQAALIVEIPDKPEHRGKRWAAMVRTGLQSGFWLDAPVKVFVETQK